MHSYNSAVAHLHVLLLFTVFFFNSTYCLLKVLSLEQAPIIKAQNINKSPGRPNEYLRLLVSEPHGETMK